MPEAFVSFPEVMALGHDRLQQFCDEWCKMPVAREFSVSRVLISEDCRCFDPNIRLDAANYDKGDIVHFPFDRLMEYVITRGFPANERQVLRDRLLLMRQSVGVELYQRFETTVDAYTLATCCPHCHRVILTQLRIFATEPLPLRETERVTCFNCNHEFVVREKDFFPVIDTEFRPDI